MNTRKLDDTKLKTWQNVIEQLQYISILLV